MTFFLTFLVLVANLLVFMLEVPHYYHAVSHFYYGVMLLAIIYDSPRGQKILLGVTTIGNIVYVALYPTETAGIVVLLLYPVLVLGIMRVIRQLRRERGVRREELAEINSANAYLEKRVRDLSTLFQVSQTANANLELEGLFRRIIEILSNRLGIYRGALHLYQEGKVVASTEVVLGLTPAEMKRGTDAHIEDIQQRVLASGKAMGVPQTRLPRSYVKLFEPENVESKDAIAFWCIPVIVEEHVVGTLTIDKASDEFSAEDDRRLLTIIASIIAQRVKIQQTIDVLVESERLAALGRLVRTIAHEVRNPLGSIRLGTQLLEQTAAVATGTGDGEKEEIRGYSEIIIKEVDRLNRFVEQLLAFSKPAMEFAKPCDIHKLLEDSLAICRAELERHAIEVVTEYKQRTSEETGNHQKRPLDAMRGPTYPAVNVNADGVTQVLLNLFYNAIEAMQSGGCLRIQTEYRDIEEMVCIRVQDTGPGIAPDDVQRLFHPFYTTKQKGTGLGLYISRNIVEEHGGSIEVDATLAVGTAFVITLPLC